MSAVPRLERVLSVIEQRYSDPALSLKTASRIVNVSEEHLGRFLSGTWASLFANIS